MKKWAKEWVTEGSSASALWRNWTEGQYVTRNMVEQDRVKALGKLALFWIVRILGTDSGTDSGTDPTLNGAKFRGNEPRSETNSLSNRSTNHHIP